MKKFFGFLFILSIFCFNQSLLAEGKAKEKAAFRDPDAIIATQELSSLPKDIISVPMLKDLLSEDFVFYYRDSGADWLSFRGALARLAYEHKTDWPTRFLAWLMNGPAEIALWKGPEGRLSQFLVVIDQTGVKSLVEELAKAMISNGGSDSQLSTIKIGDREVYALKLATQRSVYFTSIENRLFLFSDQNLPLPDATRGRGIIDRAKSFFGASAEIGVFGPKLNKLKHSIHISAPFFSFGYQSFFSEIKALRFTFDSKSWESQILAAKELRQVDSKVWSSMPRGAALCVSVPIDKKKIANIVKLQEWVDKTDSVASACWYPDSKLYSPLISVHGDYAKLLNNTNDLQKVFSYIIGSREAFWPKEVDSEAAPSQLAWAPKLAVSSTKVGTAFVLSREVGGRYGMQIATKSKNHAQLRSRRFFRVKLAANSNTILFSPDDQLVDRGLSTLDGKMPSMMASLPAQAKGASVILAPESFAKLTKQTMLESLPESQESIFRGAIAKHFFPNLDKFGKRPMQAASLSAASSANPHWIKLEWATNASH